jgi:hypothetical protein
LTTLISAFAEVSSRHPDISLVIAGQVPEHLVGTVGHPDLRGLVSSLGLGERVQITGHITDGDLGILYRRAQLFVFPSLFEGFGMPPVEALGMGLPVLTTRCASIPEATCDMADFVEKGGLCLIGWRGGKKLREPRSRYMGRLLDAARDWDHRIAQLYEGAYDHLDPPDESRRSDDYTYYHSVVFRFLNLMAIARRFQAEGVYMEPAIARPEDFDLHRYAEAFLWVMTHAELSPGDIQDGRAKKQRIGF